MNNIIICLVVAFSIVQISKAELSAFENLGKEIEKKKDDVMKLWDDLNTAKYSLDVDLNKNLTTIKNNIWTSLFDINNKEIKEIYIVLKAAQEKERNDDVCEERMIRVANFSALSFQLFVSCQIPIERDVDKAKNQIIDNIEIANKLFHQLGVINRNCNLGKLSKMMECRTHGIIKGRNDYKNLKVTADEAIANANVVFRNSLVEGKDCFDKMASIIYPRIVHLWLTCLNESYKADKIK